MKILLIFLSLSSASIFAAEKSDVTFPKTITKIAFGSCYNGKGNTPIPVFDAALKHNPDLFIFLGDNIYGDTNDMKVLKKKYAGLGANPAFQNIVKNTQVLATWDDHDYGVNDGGNDYAKRVESEKIFLDFFNEPKESARRQREGVYCSYSFGEKGKVVQIILLDTRYFRDRLPKSKAKKAPGTINWYEPTTDTSKTLLGKAQWEWLEKQLQVPADVRIIGSSIQMIAYEKGMENWGNVPHEKKRFYDLLKKHKANHTFAISGDVHFAELSKENVGSYPFYDLTSSGLTSPRKNWAEANNSFRVGKSSWSKNVGMIEIDWKTSSLALKVIDPDGKNLINHPVQFSELEFSK
ncbi:MAG: alkaline phosphatase D family protein [Rubritalea sp.]|jgi:alkaline phosphatase D